MSHWKDAVITNDGVEMLNKHMAGRKITIVAAYGGTGTVDPELLAKQSSLVDVRQELYLLGEEDGADGKIIQVQVKNTDVMTEYELNQVGVYAALDVEQDPEAPHHLLFIMQDEKGVTIPSATTASYLLELYCLIGITNNGLFEVKVSDAGVVSAAYLRDKLAQAISAHNNADSAHRSLTVRMQGIEVALNGSETISGDGDPTAETNGVKGQHYINSLTGEEFVCANVTEDGCTWEPHDAEMGACRSIESRMRAAEAALNGGETIIGDQSPDIETEGVRGQHYFDRETGTEYVCIGTTEAGYAWGPWESVDKSAFAAQHILTGQPGQVVGFDAAGAALAVRGWSNQNFADNACWAYKDAIINQPGQTEYTEKNYAISRWYNRDIGVVRITDDGLELVCNSDYNVKALNQRLEFPERFFGKTVTLSILIETNTLSEDVNFHLARSNSISLNTNGFLSADIPAGGVGLFAVTGEFVDTLDNYSGVNIGLGIGAATGTIKVKAVKFELGSQQTLAYQDAGGNWAINDPPPNKDLELLKCQRYQVLLRSTVGPGIARAKKVYIHVSLPVALRALPTISYSNASIYRGIAGERITITKISIISMDEQSIYLEVTMSESLPDGTACFVELVNGGYIMINANL